MRLLFQVRGHAFPVIFTGGALTTSKVNMCSILYANLMTS
jgi:hypothetical protein